MEKEIAGKVIEKLGKLTEATGRIVNFGNEKYIPAEISADNFHKINEKDGRIAFIDGGNNAVFEAANFSLHFCRIYYAVYSCNKRIKSKKEEFYCLASSSGKSSIEIEIFGADIEAMKISAFDSTISKGRHRANVSDAAAMCRKLAELKTAAKITDELEKGDIIILDRDLEASMTGEKELIDQLFDKASRKGAVVCGIAKTARLFTETGDSAINAVEAISPEGAWAYYPIAESRNEEHRAEVSFAKLHPKSGYVFRVDIFQEQKEEIQRALGILMKNSKDPAFLGYPYGMIEADRMARVTNEEAEYLKVKMAAKAGKQREKIFKHMKTVDAHSVLDNIS